MFESCSFVLTARGIACSVFDVGVKNTMMCCRSRNINDNKNGTVYLLGHNVLKNFWQKEMQGQSVAYALPLWNNFYAFAFAWPVRVFSSSNCIVTSSTFFSWLMDVKKLIWRAYWCWGPCANEKLLFVYSIWCIKARIYPYFPLKPVKLYKCYFEIYLSFFSVIQPLARLELQ